MEDKVPSGEGDIAGQSIGSGSSEEHVQLPQFNLGSELGASAVHFEPQTDDEYLQRRLNQQSAENAERDARATAAAELTEEQHRAMESAAADLADLSALAHAAEQWTNTEEATTTPVPPEETECASTAMPLVESRPDAEPADDANCGRWETHRPKHTCPDSPR